MFYNTLYRLIILITTCLLFSTSANADLFTPNPGDESINILGMIFGPNIGNIILGGQANPGLVRMFEILNITAVSIGTLIVSYVGVVSLVNTAQEGKAMGKKWGNMWIPLRSFIGMALLVPTPHSGYSVAQMGVMWMVMQGVGVADRVWEGILDAFAQNHGPSTGIILNHNNNSNPLPDEAADHNLSNAAATALLVQGARITENVLYSATCAAGMEYLFHNYQQQKTNEISKEIKNYGNLVQIYHINANQESTMNAAAYTGTVFVGIPGHSTLFNMCGTYKIRSQVNKDSWPRSMRNKISQEDINTKAASIYKDKIDSIKLIYATLISPSRELYANQSPRLGYRALSINLYSNLLSSHVIPTLPNERVMNSINYKKQAGWITAGPFYLTLNRSMDNRVSLLFPSINSDQIIIEDVPRCTNINPCLTPAEIEANLPKLNSIVDYPDERTVLIQNLSKANQFFQDDQYEFKNNFRLDDVINSDLLNKLGEAKERHRLLNEEFDTIFETNILKNKLLALRGNNQDPIYVLATLGNQLLESSENKMLDFIKDPAEYINRIRAMNDGNEDHIAQARENLAMTAIGIGVFVTFSTAAATLAYYIPFVPFMIFTVTSIGWVIMVIEAVVAAPILVLGLIMPSGEELGKIVSGLMILLNIVLRPLLILFGFILATRLFKAIFVFVQYGLNEYTEEIQFSNSMIGTIIVTIMYVVFLVSLTNRCFSLIYLLPDKILRWIGGGPEQTDVSQEVQMVKGGIQRVGDAAQKYSAGASKESLERQRIMLDHLNKK